MKHLATQRIAAPLLGLALAAAAPLSASAQGSDGWQFEASLNGWFPAISGTTMFPSGASGPSIDVSMGDVVDALKFTFQGTFEARRGQWGLWTDLVYADFGASRQHSRDFTIGGNQIPVGVDANLVLDIKSWIWTLAGLLAWAIWRERPWAKNLLFGVTAGYTIWYWSERLVWQMPRPNWPFAVILNLVLIVFIIFTTKSPTREAYERESEHQQVESS